MFENNQSQSRWRPGLPVLTAADHADWTQWRKDRKRQQQRDRRARYPRIDYYPDGDALALIDSVWTARVQR